ncbi:MAG: YkgJ family cysteine cluster protein [Desulfobulbaceae bacterium]|nr:YkgJ family cysteine cluster protein [Desulfobulbaceae bacterium]
MNSLDPLSLKQCVRCGTCCREGGPALHHEDKALLLAGHFGYQHLITVRKGEFAYTPVSGRFEPVITELVKIAGRGGDWSCPFLESGNNSCFIYDHRPLECRLQKCWDTSDLIAAIGKDTIVRSDIINPGDEILKVIETHERECSCVTAEKIVGSVSREPERAENLAELTELVRKDISIRVQAMSELGLPDAWEFFVFGRPLFKVLQPRGVMAYEADGRIHLKWHSSC